jgi:hypothetical protein
MPCVIAPRCTANHQRSTGHADEHLKLMGRLNTVMVQLRSLMPSVSKEVKFP